MILLPGRSSSWADPPEFVGSQSDGTNTGTHTYSFTLPASRLVIGVFMTGDAPVDPLTVQVGGNATTLRAEGDENGTGATYDLYEYDETTGGSINITVAHPTGNIFRSMCFVWDVKSLTFKSGSGTTSGGNPNTAAPITQTITNTAGSCCISVAATPSGSYTGFAGSNGHNASPDAVENPEGTWRACGFMQPSTAGGSPESFTIDESGGGTLVGMVSGIWE